MTRGIPADLTGQRFGRLEAIYRNGSDRQNNALWLCRCDCGNTVSVRALFLRKGQRFCSKQCPLYAEPMRVDISGRRFGKLTAARYVRSTPSGKSVWLFQCDCGNAPELVHDNVCNGHTTSCGCYGEVSRVKHGKSQTREYHRNARREWAKRNPAKVIANAMQRKKSLRQRIPPWLTDEHWDAINAFYVEAKRLTEETGVPHHVDHKYPLRGKTVSGLHVPWNLQIMTAEDNLHKANRLFDEVC